MYKAPPILQLIAGRAFIYLSTKPIHAVEPQELIKIIKQRTGLEIYYYNLLLEGWDNIVLEVNGALIFRFTRRPDILQQHIKELELLPLLNRSLTLRVPNPIYHQTEKPPYYMAYKKIIGDPITNTNTKPITSFLRELQTIDHTKLQQIKRYTPETWKQEYLELHNRIKREIQSHLDQETRKTIDNAFNQFHDSYLDFKPTLCHRDLTKDHILEIDGRITGIIDWGDACVGDPAFDLTGFILGFGEPIAKQLIKELEYPS